MGKSRSAGWIGGTAVLIIAILAATYMFLYSPRSEQVDETLALADEARSRNDLLEIQVADLSAKARNMDQYLDQLAEIETQMPSTADIDAITLMLRQDAEARGLTVKEVAPSPPAFVAAPTEPAPAAPAPGTDTGAAPTDDGTAVDQAQDTAEQAEDAAQAQNDPNQQPAEPQQPAVDPAAISGLVAIPVRVTAVGTYENALAYLDYMQNHDGRLFMVGEVQATRQATQPETPDIPALNDGDLELVISGYVYVLLDTVGAGPVIADLRDDGELNDSAAPALPEDGETPKPVLPTSPVNPFVPLTPSQAQATP